MSDLAEKKKTEYPAPDYHSGHRARLRERFLKGGADAVADYEILEMILFAASPRSDVKNLAKRIIHHCGSFSKAIKSEPSALRKIEGVTDAVISALKVVEVSAHRLLSEEIKAQPVITSWNALLEYCILTMGHKQTEEFHLLFLNHKNALIADELQGVGTIDHAPVYPREVVRRALEIGATAIILVHNHPSGDVEPSKADIDMTRQIITAAHPLGVKVHDHIIVGANKTFSFKSRGLI